MRILRPQVESKVERNAVDLFQVQRRRLGWCVRHCGVGVAIVWAVHDALQAHKVDAKSCAAIGGRLLCMLTGDCARFDRASVDMYRKRDNDTHTANRRGRGARYGYMQEEQDRYFINVFDASPQTKVKIENIGQLYPLDPFLESSKGLSPHLYELSKSQIAQIGSSKSIGINIEFEHERTNQIRINGPAEKWKLV